MPNSEQTIPEDALEAARKNTQQLIDQVGGQIPSSMPVPEPAQADPAAQPAPQPIHTQMQIGILQGKIVISLPEPARNIFLDVDGARRLANHLKGLAKNLKYAPVRR